MSSLSLLYESIPRKALENTERSFPILERVDLILSGNHTGNQLGFCRFTTSHFP